MRATDFEFRHRFWIIGAPFFLGFVLYRADHVNAVERVLGWVSRGLVAPGKTLPVRVAVLAGAALVVGAALVRTWAAAYLRSEVVHDHSLHAERLVADGPFRHVRNPLYLGTFLMAVGLSPLASLTGAIVMVGGTALVLERLIGREEEELTRTQGAAYAAYRASVPSVIPALAPRVPASGARPRWGQAVRGEVLTWAFALGTLVLGVTLNSRVGLGVWTAGFVAHLLLRRTSRADGRDGADKTDWGPRGRPTGGPDGDAG
ncbi:MAG: isoprenylcysteine carboxylmethyltransferase family protein [Gemmatimonadetes bacterium]|nr:isoprenylcysteine carboxylmethyltransferase family protein [Gemmatimonadota bacterium]